MKRWLSIGMGLVALGHSVLAMPMPQSFSLQPHNEARELEIDLDPTSREVTFTKEPAGLGDDVVRGAIPLAEDASDFVGFAWDEAGKKLYVDLNRNLDLTDDAAGVFSSAEGWRQEFPDIQLEVNRDGFPVRTLLSLGFYSFGPQNVSATATIRSGWQGAVSLNGQSWRLSVIDNLDGEIGAGDRLTLSGLSTGGVPLVTARDMDELEATSRLFLGGQGYDLAFNFEVGDPDTALAATFTPIDMPMGELQLEGNLIARINLQGEVTAILDHPAPTTRVPAGTYETVDVYVSGVSNTDVYATQIEALQIEAEATTPLTTGAPLNNSVVARRSGRSLDLDYELRGCGGREFERVSAGGDRPDPTFVIRRGGKQVASGNFEYG